MSRKKRDTRRARTQYVHNYLYRLATERDTWNYGHNRKPDDPWYHIPFEDLVKTMKVWYSTFSNIPIMQFVEQTLGSPKPKKYGDESK